MKRSPLQPRRRTRTNTLKQEAGTGATPDNKHQDEEQDQKQDLDQELGMDGEEENGNGIEFRTQ